MPQSKQFSFSNEFRKPDMRDQLVDIRPKIKSIDQECQSDVIEDFQNKSIRPIIKFQNNLLIDIFLHHISKYSNAFSALSKKDQLEFIETATKRDNRLRCILLGTVIGIFTNEEWIEYVKNEKEYNRRINDMIFQRLQGKLVKKDNHQVLQ